jgi:hypothetical protein
MQMKKFVLLQGPLVRYHCGGWSEAVISCILISYMVYLIIIIIITYISTQTEFKDTAANTTILYCLILLIAIGFVVLKPYTVGRWAVQIAFIELVDEFSWLQDEGSNKPVDMRMVADGMKMRDLSKLLQNWDDLQDDSLEIGKECR